MAERVRNDTAAHAIFAHTRINRNDFAVMVTNEEPFRAQLPRPRKAPGGIFALVCLLNCTGPRITVKDALNGSLFNPIFGG